MSGLNRIYLLAGGNLGEREDFLTLAREQTVRRIGNVLRVSPIYETAAWGLRDQPDFLNQAWEVDTLLPAAGVLQAIHQIERDLGRRFRRTWGEREIDIDLLFYGREVIDMPDLQVPHPRLAERRFALQPLFDLIPEWRHPQDGRTISEMLAQCPDDSAVRPYNPLKSAPSASPDSRNSLPTMYYQLVTVEGNIGAGKTTLARYFARDFSGKLILERFEDNPFLPKFFEDFKQNAFATELYFMAERYHQLSREMQEPELFADKVVMDYLFTKSLLFAKANLTEEEFHLFHKLFHIINPRLPEPQLVLYVHADVDRLIRNIQSRGRDFEQGVDPAYLAKIQANYFAWFRQHPHLRILVVDNNEADYVKNEADYNWYVRAVSQPWKPGLHFLKVGESLPEPEPETDRR